MEFVKFLIEQNAEIRKQNIALAEQNKLLSLALFSNNPDAMRAYGAMQKTTSVYSSIPTPTDLGETK